MASEWRMLAERLQVADLNESTTSMTLLSFHFLLSVFAADGEVSPQEQTSLIARSDSPTVLVPMLCSNTDGCSSAEIPCAIERSPESLVRFTNFNTNRSRGSSSLLRTTTRDENHFNSCSLRSGIFG